MALSLMIEKYCINMEAFEGNTKSEVFSPLKIYIVDFRIMMPCSIICGY
jgi:hypothetical protein